MTINLSHDADVRSLVDKTSHFVRSQVLPVEDQHGGDIAAAGGDLRRAELQEAARQAGVFAPHAPIAYGGQGATRALLMQACWELDEGSHAGNATSIAKVFASEANFRVVDRSIQMCGGLGVSDDLPLARLSREVCPFRVYDAPSEVHRWALAKRAVSAARKASCASVLQEVSS
jgi:alkylation response protein AidB-like acyl-CoA dehydrogenase